MSETLEHQYESFSEATENDVRADPIDADTEVGQQEDDDEGGEEPVVEETPEVVATEDDLQARNARLAHELREQRRHSKMLEREAQALRGERTETRDETIDREVALRSHAMVEQQKINDKANAVYHAGVKQFGRMEFEGSVSQVREAFGTQMPLLIETLVDQPGAEKLLHYFAENPDILDNMTHLSPHKLGAAVQREITRLNTPKVSLSKTPRPIQPVNRNAGGNIETNLEKMSMEQLDKLWSKRDFERQFR